MKSDNKIITELPHGKWGVDWQSTVGMEIDILYNGETYKIDIIGYKDKRIYTSYNGFINKKGIMCNSFSRGCFGRVLKLITTEFKYEIGSIFKTGKYDLTIIDRKYVPNNKNNNNEKWYKYICNICGWTEGWMIEGSLNRGSGCSCCAGRTVVPEINSIKAKAPWMIGLGVSKEDSIKYTPCSNKKIEITCPDCGNKRVIQISNLYKKKSIGCRCGDGRSYPEKFIINMFNQLNVEFITEYSPDYLYGYNGIKTSKRSDFYLPSYNLVIEADGGLGHFGGVVHGKSRKSLEDHIAIDEWKDKKHKEHGIKTMRINCFESDMEYIKNSLSNSELKDIFQLDRVCWSDCDKYALKNLVFEVCKSWNAKNNDDTTADIASIFNVNISTVRDYLKKGNRHGWCEYNPKEEIRKTVSNNGKLNKKKVEVLKDGITLGFFESATELSVKSEEIFGVKLDRANISQTCIGSQKTHKGFTFKYI